MQQKYLAGVKQRMKRKLKGAGVSTFHLRVGDVNWLDLFMVVEVSMWQSPRIVRLD